MFGGAIVAVVTPFRQGKVDEAGLRDLIEFQIANGTSGIVPCGTTGESPTLTHKEHERVVEVAIEQTAGRIPVIAGTGSNSTEEAISLTQHAKKAGADAALMISPYYNKPTQEGIYRHFEQVAKAVDIPTIVYNIPGRTGSNMEPATIARLSRIDNIVGVKESSGSMNRSRMLSPCAPMISLCLCGKITSPSTDMRWMQRGHLGCVKRCSEANGEPLQAIFRRQDGRFTQALLQGFTPAAHLFDRDQPVPVKAALS